MAVIAAIAYPRGLGHLTSIAAVGEGLEKRGHKLHYFTGKLGIDFFKSRFKNVYEIPTVTWYEYDYKIGNWESVANLGFPLPWKNPVTRNHEWKKSQMVDVPDYYFKLRDLLKKIRPDVVVVDGDLEALRWPIKNNVPSVFITNATGLKLPPGARPFMFLPQRLAKSYLRKSRVVIRDLPPPYTISAYNIPDWHKFDEEDFVGPLFELPNTDGNGKEDGHVFASSGGELIARNNYSTFLRPSLKRTFEDNPELRSMNSHYDFVMSLSKPGSKFVEKGERYVVKGWFTEEEWKKTLDGTSVMIIPASHLQCLVSINSGIPTILTPTFEEQENNAKRMQELNCSVSIQPKDIKRDLAKALFEIKDTYSDRLESIQKIREELRSLNGLERTMDIVEQALKV